MIRRSSVGTDGAGWFSVRASPQFEQNLAPGSTGAPHRGQRRMRAAPHEAQNRASSPALAPQDAHTRATQRLYEPYPRVADPTWVLALGESLDEVHYRLGVPGRVEVPGLDMLGTLELDQRDQIRASPSKLAAGADRN